jgi:uncharacterized protein (DUF2147 family)
MFDTNKMLARAALAAAAMLLPIASAHAQDSPVGLWKTIDDETQQPKSLIRITEKDGALTGTSEKLINPSTPDPKCDKCTDDRKDMPITGMTILTGLKKVGGDWEDGRILDPNNGKTYKAKAKLQDGGKKLEVRGFIGISLLGRSQVWLREE